jgi:hypothetical protein
LIEAHLDVRFDNEPWPKETYTIHLICLRRLYISHLEILRYLIAPALQDLTIRVFQHELLLDDVERFMERSLCDIRRFAIRGFPDTPQVTSTLQKFPFIVELGIFIDDASSPAAEWQMT